MMSPELKWRPGIPWQEIAKKVQEHRDQTIAKIQPAVPGLPENIPLNVTAIPKQLLSAEEIQITELTPEALVAEISAARLTSTEVVTAYLRRAGIAQKLVGNRSAG